MIKIEVDMKNFDKALDEYMTFSKKAPADILNSKCYFIARNATFTTGASSKAKIKSELEAPSRKNPKVPLGAILVNKKLKQKGSKGLSGSKMNAAVKKLINIRSRSINFLRSGWIPAISILENALKRGDITFTRRFQPPVNRQVKAKGKPKGDAIWARDNVDRPSAEISNAIQGGKTASADAHKRMLNGLQAAIEKEVASMRSYIEKKYNDQIAKFNR